MAKITTKEQALLILSRLHEIKSKPKPSFGDREFPEQYEFIHATDPLAAALCTRRAGKSYAVGEKLFKKAFDYPGATVLYLALTRDSAERIMWKDILPVIARKKGIDYTPNKSKLTITLENGSVIKLAGADADEKEKEKFLGGKYAYVAIDEAGSFTTNLEQLVYEYLEPAVADYDGCIDLIGTPTIFWQGFFCKVTEGNEKGWSIYRWNTSQNPFMPSWPKRLAMLKERDPRIEETPHYKRMYLGQWVKDADALVYKFNPILNITDLVPETAMVGQVCGIDLGFNDATAYSLAQYYKNDPCLYFVHAYKKSGQIVDDIVAVMREFIDLYDVKRFVFDNASKQVVETIKARFNLWQVIIEAAEKSDKMAYIELMNSDFVMERIKLLRNKTETLAEEYSNLIKDPNSLVKKEHPSCDNHLCDASLYAWRAARNYMEQPKPAELPEEDELELKLEEAHKRDLAKRREDDIEMEFQLPWEI